MNIFTNISGSVIQRVLTIISYTVPVILLFYIIFNVVMGKEMISDAALLNWDAKHYFSIKNNAYNDVYTVAFFPLFPFLWKLLSLGITGIVIFNSVIFLAGFLLFTVIMKPTTKEILLFLSLPSLIFMFLPYSEAIFFISSIVLLWGLMKKNMLITCIGFFLCGLARPVAVFFIPAILIMEFLLNKNKFVFIKRSLIYCSVTIISLLVVGAIQHSYTGQWFGFFKAQHDWENYLQIPSLPLTSWAGDTIVRLDGSALLVGLVSLLALIKYFIQYLKDRKPNVTPEFFFSLLYLTGISLYVLFFRGGSLFSLNRFVFCTPFFMVALYHFLKTDPRNFKQIGYIMLLITLFWLLFNSWVHIMTFLKYLFLTVYICSYFLINNKNKIIKNIAFTFCLVFNICFQLYFYYRFLSEEWVG